MGIQTKEILNRAIVEEFLPETLTAERDRTIELVRRWGGSASNAVLDPVCKIFTVPNIEGLIGYRMESGCAIVFGDPICPPENIPSLVHAFHSYCQAQGATVVYVTATQQFAKWAMENICKASLAFGEEIVIDPYCDPRALKGANACVVRRKVKHAKHEAVEVKEYIPHDKKLEQAMEQVGTEWLKSRHGPQIYIAHIRLFCDRIGKRWFYARHGNQIVGVFTLNQLNNYQGWLLSALMITPSAPHGTPELLVTTAIDTLRAEGCHYITCGSVPGDTLGEIVGLNTISTWLMRQIFKVAKKIFNLNGRMKFWEKFQPKCRPSYILFTEPDIRLREIWAIMRAMNVGLSSNN